MKAVFVIHHGEKMFNFGNERLMDVETIESIKKKMDPNNEKIRTELTNFLISYAEEIKKTDPALYKITICLLGALLGNQVKSLSLFLDLYKNIIIGMPPESLSEYFNIFIQSLDSEDIIPVATTIVQ